MAGSNGKDFVVNLLADATQAVSEMDGFASKVGPIAAGIGAAWTAADVGGQLMESLTKGVDVQATENTLMAALGSGDVAQGAGEEAGRLYRQGLDSELGSVNESVRAVVQNIASVDELGAAAFEKITTNAHNLAGVMDEDVTRVTAAAASMIRSGLAPDAEHAFDVIATGAANGADKAGDLLDTFEEYSVQFNQLGLSAEDALGLMNQGLDAGARNSDIVADGLKEFALRAQEAMSTPIDISAVRDAQQAVVDATQQAQDAIAAADRNVASAEDGLTRAQQDQKSAQMSLTQARRDAKQALEDLADQVEGAALSERSAKIAVAEAEDRLRDLQGKPYDQTEWDRAQLNYDQAVYNLKEQSERTKDLRQEKRAADKAGVDGSEQVKTAQQGVTDSTKALQDAQRQVADAQTAAARAQADGARSVQDANAALVAASTPQLTTMGQAYRKLGLDGESIGARVARGGDAAKGALQETLDALRAVDDPAERAQLAVQIFGTKAEDMQGALYALDPATATAAEGIDRVDGASDRLSNTIGGGVLNKKTALENTLASWESHLVSLDGPLGDATAGIMAFGPPILGVVGSIAPLISGMVAWRVAQAATTPVVAAGSVANAGYAATMWAATWPLLATAAAVGLVGLGIYELIAHFDDVKDWLGDHWGDVLAVMTGPFGLGTKFIIDHFGDIKHAAGDALNWVGGKLDWVGDKIGDLPGRLKGLAKGAAEGLMWAGIAPLQAFVWFYNNTIGKIGFSTPDWIPSALGGGKHWSVPDLPMPKVPALAQGGITNGPTLAYIGDNVGGREVVAPLDEVESWVKQSGDGTPVVIVLKVGEQELARVMRRVGARGAY